MKNDDLNLIITSLAGPNNLSKHKIESSNWSESHFFH